VLDSDSNSRSLTTFRARIAAGQEEPQVPEAGSGVYGEVSESVHSTGGRLYG
jgi:hypothetical protein